MNYEETFTNYSSFFEYTQKDFYGENPVTYEKSCIWSQKDSFDSPHGEVFIEFSFEISFLFEFHLVFQEHFCTIRPVFMAF